LGNNAVIKSKGKIIKLLSNENIKISESESRVLLDNDYVVIGAGTFAVLGDSTQYPDPYTMITVLPNSEFKVSIKPWEHVDNKNDERTTGFKITKIELLKGIFKIDTGAVVKAANVEFIFPKGKGTVKIEIVGNSLYIGGNNLKISGSFTKTPLNVTQFSEYIIVGSDFYKKSMLAMNEENMMDERFIAIDSVLMKVVSSASDISQYKDSGKMFETMDKNAESFNPDAIAKNFDTAMNMNPEMLKGMNLSPEQVTQMTEGLSHLKKIMTPDKMSEIKNALGKVKKEDLVKMNKTSKDIMASAPKMGEIIKAFEALTPYGRRPSKLGECEEAEN